MSSSNRKVNRQLFAEGVLLILAVLLTGFSAFGYLGWYDATVPLAPLPEGARLLSREPDLSEGDFPYNSSIVRFWYNAKYSTKLPYQEVEAFYRNKHDASPFGSFSIVKLVAPVQGKVLSHGVREPDYANRPFERTEDDPPNETLIFIEVQKAAGDRQPQVFLICLPFLVFIVGLVVIISRRSNALANERATQKREALSRE